MRLPELQRLWLAHLTSADDADSTGRLESQINAGPVAKSARIAVYANNYREIVCGALRSVFPGIEQLVGEPCFRSLAHVYGQSNASHRGDLQSFGRSFPALLDRTYVATQYAWLGDVARLEFALDECLTCAGLTGISGDQLQAAICTEGSDVRLTPNPSAHLIESPFPILGIWRAQRDADFENVSVDAGPQNVAVVRVDNDAQMTLVSSAGARLIYALMHGATMDDAVCSLGPADSGHLARALRDIVVSGAFTQVTTTCCRPT